MTNSNDKQAVAVKTKVNAGKIEWSGPGDELKALTSNHNETVAVKTAVIAGRKAGGDPTFG